MPKLQNYTILEINFHKLCKKGVLQSRLQEF